MAGSTLGHEQFAAGIHRHIRMWIFAALGSLIVGGLVFAGAVRLITTPPQRQAGIESYKITFAIGNRKQKTARLTRLQPELGRFQHAVNRSAPLGLGGAVGAFILIIRIFGAMGEKAKDEKYKRGAKLVTPAELSSRIKKEAKNRKTQCQFNIGNVPMLAGFERTHIFAGGTTGAGKSTFFRSMFDQIRKANQKAVIYDPGGHYLAQFAEEGDWLLNPFDRRADGWCIFGEIRQKPDCRAVSAALIPEAKGGENQFWTKTARTVLADLLWQIKSGPGQANNAVLLTWLKSSTEDLAEYLSGTMAAALLSGENAKRADDIRVSMLTDLFGFEYLTDSPDRFSIRNWVQNGTGWLFITSREETRETMEPLISLWIELVAIQLLSMPETGTTRVWLAIDELADLHKLEALPKLLAQGRKYGGAIMLATQNFPQLREKYGKEGSAGMLDLLTTKLFLRIKDPEAQKYASDSLGEREYDTLKKSDTVARSQGPSTGLSDDTKRDPLVLASEFGNLPTGTCYLDPSEHFPPCKLELPDFPAEKHVPCFEVIDDA